MKNKLTSVTIGIPAYNEEKNIGKFLTELLKQKREHYELEKIIVISDGSNDETVNEVKSCKNSLVSVIDSPERKGKALRLNQLINNTNSDILVILDADVLIQDKLFLERLIKPIVESDADLTSAAIEELEPRSFIQKMLEASMKFKKNIFERYKKGNNLYTCYGRAQAFSRKLYSTINFADMVPDDAFSYLFCKLNNFKYIFTKEAKIFYKLPETLADHEKQSIRFFRAYQGLSYIFPNKILRIEYYLPKKIIVPVLLQSIVNYPILLLYFLIATYIKIKSFFVKLPSAKWDISKSTKLIESNL